MAPRKPTAAVANATALAKVKETFRKGVIQLLASTPGGQTNVQATCVASMQENDVCLQVMEAGGENWVRKMTGDQKWFPVMARVGKRARTEDEEGDEEEVEATAQASTSAPSKKSKKTQVTPENRPKKKTAATPQAPPRRQPRRSATTPTPLAGLNADNLAHIEDDTKSCSTSVFDEQIGALLARGMAKDQTEQEEMIAAREAERLIRLEERDDLASLFDEMEVQSAFERDNEVQAKTSTARNGIQTRSSRQLSTGVH